MSKQLESNDNILNLDQNYKSFLKELKSRLKTSQIKASLAVNKELIKFYWELGSDIIKYQKQYKWGEKFLEKLSHDLRQNAPGMQGFSVTNLKRMKLFALAYPDFETGAQLVHQLPWGHIVILLHRLKDADVRLWYVQRTLEYGWSRSILEMQIESDLCGRQGLSEKKISTTINIYQPLNLI